MESLQENKPLLYSLLFSGAAITALASGLLPDVSNHFELVELTSEVSVHTCICIGVCLYICMSVHVSVCACSINEQSLLKN